MAHGVRALAVAVVLSALAGCTGTRPAPTAAAGTAPAAGASTARDLRAWARCIRDHGINMPDPDPVTGQLPGFDKGKQNPNTFRKAVDACAAFEPVQTRDRSPLTPAELAQKRQWAVCMRDHSVPVPDPDPNDPFGPHFERLPNMPPGAQVDSALAACVDKLPPRVRGAS
jgi:hypothetical protein